MATENDILVNQLVTMLKGDFSIKGVSTELFAVYSNVAPISFEVYFRPRRAKTTQCIYKGQDFSKALATMRVYETKEK